MSIGLIHSVDIQPRAAAKSRLCSLVLHSKNVATTVDPSFVLHKILYYTQDNLECLDGTDQSILRARQDPYLCNYLPKLNTYLCNLTHKLSNNISISPPPARVNNIRYSHRMNIKTFTIFHLLNTF